MRLVTDQPRRRVHRLLGTPTNQFDELYDPTVDLDVVRPRDHDGGHRGVHHTGGSSGLGRKLGDPLPPREIGSRPGVVSLPRIELVANPTDFDFCVDKRFRRRSHQRSVVRGPDVVVYSPTTWPDGRIDSLDWARSLRPTALTSSSSIAWPRSRPTLCSRRSDRWSGTPVWSRGKGFSRTGGTSSKSKRPTDRICGRSVDEGVEF